MVADYLIVVEKKAQFDVEPILTHRLIEISLEFAQGFFAGVVLCYPDHTISMNEIEDVKP